MLLHEWLPCAYRCQARPHLLRGSSGTASGPQLCCQVPERVWFALRSTLRFWPTQAFPGRANGRGRSQAGLQRPSSGRDAGWRALAGARNLVETALPLWRVNQHNGIPAACIGDICCNLAVPDPLSCTVTAADITHLPARARQPPLPTTPSGAQQPRPGPARGGRQLDQLSWPRSRHQQREA